MADITFMLCYFILWLVLYDILVDVLKMKITRAFGDQLV